MAQVPHGAKGTVDLKGSIHIGSASNSWPNSWPKRCPWRPTFRWAARGSRRVRFAAEPN